MKSIFFLVSLFALTAITSSVEAATTTPTILTQAETESKVRAYFKDTPVMIEIARCESKFRQFTDGGSVLKGGSAGGMVGIFQFFESIHAPIAKKLGFDLNTVDGNLGYAKHLHTSEGTTPWASAKDCWDVEPTVVKTPPSRAELEAKIKQLTQLVKLLLQLQELKTSR